MSAGEEQDDRPGKTPWAKARLKVLVRTSQFQKKQIAFRAGKPPQWLSNRLNGHSPVYADDVLLLARGLGITACTFFDDEPAPPAEVPQPFRQAFEPDAPGVGRMLRRLHEMAREDRPTEGPSIEDLDPESEDAVRLALLRQAGEAIQGLIELEERRQEGRDR